MYTSKQSCFRKFWSKKFVWLNIVVVSSQMFLLVATLSWTSSAIPKIQGLTKDVVDNLGNLFLFGTLLGSIFTYFTLTYLSRKLALISNEVILLISWPLLYFKSNVSLLYIGRFLAGIAAASIALSQPAYEAECFHPKDRQLSAGIMCLYTAAAFWIEFSLAPFISYESVLIINLVPVVLFLIYFPCFGAETPYIHVKNGNILKARNVMQVYWSRDSTQHEIDEELENIKVTIAEERKIGVLGAFKSIFTNRKNLKTTILALVLLSFYCMTGFIQLSMYMEPILFQAQVKEISPETSSAVIGTIKLIGAVLSLPTINYIGVKKTLLLTLTMNTISMIMLGGYFFAKTKTDNLSAVFWLPLISFSIFFMATLMGSCMIPFLIRGELLPSYLRGPGGASTDLLSSVFGIGINYMYDAFSDSRIYLDFWIFAILTVFYIVFVYFCIPETKDKTLHEIQEQLNNK